MEKKNLEVGTMIKKYNGVMLAVVSVSRGMATFARGFRNRMIPIYEQAPVNHILKCSLYSVVE